MTLRSQSECATGLRQFPKILWFLFCERTFVNSLPQNKFRTLRLQGWRPSFHRITLSLRPKLPTCPDRPHLHCICLPDHDCLFVYRSGVSPMLIGYSIQEPFRRACDPYTPAKETVQVESKASTLRVSTLFLKGRFKPLSPITDHNFAFYIAYRS